jgi:hypothetical protein
LSPQASAAQNDYMPDIAYEWLAAFEDVVKPVEHLSLSDYGYADAGSAPEPDFDHVTRHQGFKKAFLLILLCGGLIRYLTSPTFSTFKAHLVDIIGAACCPDRMWIISKK